MKISKTNKEVFKAVTILLFLIGLQYTFILEQTTFLYPYFLCVASLILLFLGYWKTVKYMVSYLCYQVLHENEKYEFVTRISRVKWFFSITGLVLSVIGVKFLFNVSFATFESTHLYAIRNGLVFFIICGCIYINNKYIETFETKRPKLNIKGLPIECKPIINKSEFKLKAIFNILNGEDSKHGLFKGEYSSFEAFIKLEEIKPEEKMLVLKSKAELLRFIHVIFDFKLDITSEAKKNLINHYFYKKIEGDKNIENDEASIFEQDFILDSDTSISRINSYIINKDDLFINYKNILTTILHSHRTGVK